MSCIEVGSVSQKYGVLWIEIKTTYQGNEKGEEKE